MIDFECMWMYDIKKGADVMLTQERHACILHALEERKTVTVSELTRELDTSESTIRRDLNYLHDKGKLKKVHGGATLLQEDFTTLEFDMETKSSMNIEEKERIAKYAATLIRDEDFVYIDAGSTTEKMVDYITNNRAVFVTNGIAHAKKLTQKGCMVYVIGGKLKLSTEAIIGAEGVNSLQKYNFTKAFLGCNGLTMEQGVTTPDVEEALLKREVIKKSQTTFLLVDHTKFGQITPVVFADIEEVVIITDHTPEKKYKEKTVVKEV